MSAPVASYMCGLIWACELHAAGRDRQLTRGRTRRVSRLRIGRMPDVTVQVLWYNRRKRVARDRVRDQMLDAEAVPEIRSTDRDMGWNVVVALAIGLLLGVLVSFPYEQAFGLAAPLTMPVKCLASLVIFSSLANGRSAEVASAVRSSKGQTGRRSALPRGPFPSPGSPTMFDAFHLFASGSPEPRFRSGAS